MADYSRALELHPRHAKALYNRAVARERLRQLAPALEDYSAVLALDPGNVPARLNRAGLLQRLGRPAEALADVNAVLEAESSMQRCSGGSGGGSGDDRQEDGADCVDTGASAGSSSVSSSSTAAAAWHLRGELLAELGHGAEALAAHERAAALNPASSALRRAYGLALRTAGRHEAAAAVLASALTAAPEPDEAALSALGFCLRKIGRWDDAAAAYSELLVLLQRQLRQRGPGGASAGARGADVSSALVRTLNSRAFCLASGGGYAAAVADYDAALGLDPGNGHALMNRGLCLDKVGAGAAVREALVWGRLPGAGCDYSSRTRLPGRRWGGTPTRWLTSRR